MRCRHTDLRDRPFHPVSRHAEQATATLKNRAPAKVHSKVRRLLAKYDYPPGAEEKAVGLSLEQAELLANGVADR